MNIDLRLEWFDDEPQIQVTRHPEGLEVLVDPRLSHDQVRAACEEIDGAGELVLQRWEQTVGVTGESAR
jgi:hypothetical protein